MKKKLILLTCLAATTTIAGISALVKYRKNRDCADCLLIEEYLNNGGIKPTEMIRNNEMRNTFISYSNAVEDIQNWAANITEASSANIGGYITQFGRIKNLAAKRDADLIKLKKLCPELSYHM